jgi:hypothetical protein
MFITESSAMSVAETERVSQCVRRGIDYLAASQLMDGEFQTEFCAQKEVTEDGRTIEHLIFDSSPFVTSLLIESLQFAKDVSPAVPQLIERGVAFLQSEMDTGGLWRYWARKNPRRNIIPPDLDDTACVSHALLGCGVKVPNNRGLIYDSRDPQGRFYTWLYQANSLRKKILSLRTRGQAFSFSEELWQWTTGTDVCVVVNANVLRYLGDTRGTRKAIQYVVDTVLQNREEKEIVFYATPSCLYYMMTRAYFLGLKAFQPAMKAIEEKIWALEQPDDGFGDELLTGLGICSLLNLGVSRNRLRGAVEYLVGTQMDDGSWRRVPMYGGPPVPTTFGSADLTTGFCLEALARYAPSL